MKKVLGLILFFVLFFGVTVTGISASNQLTIGDEKVKFAVGNIICSDLIECDDNVKIKLHKEHLYDLELNKIGYVYKFEVKKTEIMGFVILIEREDEYIVSEIILTEIDPYNISKGKNIYVGYGEYFELYKGKLYDTINEVYLNYTGDESILYDDDYTIPDASVDVTINYIYKTETENYLPNKFPLLSTLIKNHDSDPEDDDQAGNCSQTAAVALMNYYDEDFPELVEGVSPLYNAAGEHYTYSEYNTSSDEMIALADLHDEFYSDMSNFGSGTLSSQFMSGLRNYVVGQGYSIEYDHFIGCGSCIIPPLLGLSFSDGDNWEIYKDKIDLGLPVVIQLGGGILQSWYTIIDEVDDDINEVYAPDTVNWITYDYVRTETYSTHDSGHTVVGYGYKEIEYYNMFLEYMGNFRTDRFAVLANGWSGTAYLNVDDEVSITSATSVRIFTVDPDVYLSGVAAIPDAIFYSINIDDPNNTIDYEASTIKVYQGRFLKSSIQLPTDGVRKANWNLNDNTLYTIKVNVVYNLKDGTGNHTITITRYIRTPYDNGIGILM